MHPRRQNQVLNLKVHPNQRALVNLKLNRNQNQLASHIHTQNQRLKVNQVQVGLNEDRFIVSFLHKRQILALHPMDCSDMIIGSAIGSLSRVEDYYSINRATPMVDEVYGGSQSLTAATGFEENGITTVMFRRKLLSNDLADHNITDAPMTVIWAKGQEPGKYNHTPNSGLEASDGKASKSFYGHDVLAYHGHQNRGVLSMNFFEKPIKDTTVCRGEQVYPPGCHGSICQYNVTWMKVGESVDFMMDVKMATNRWTGIGFSKDGAMVRFQRRLQHAIPTLTCLQLVHFASSYVSSRAAWRL